jgi:hypothetical protein
MKVGIARYAVPGGKAAGRNCQSVGLTTFVAPAIRARTAQRAVPTKLTHYTFLTCVDTNAQRERVRVRIPRQLRALNP